MNRCNVKCEYEDKYYLYGEKVGWVGWVGLRFAAVRDREKAKRRKAKLSKKEEEEEERRERGLLGF